MSRSAIGTLLQQFPHAAEAADTKVEQGFAFNRAYKEFELAYTKISLPISTFEALLA